MFNPRSWHIILTIVRSVCFTSPLRKYLDECPLPFQTSKISSKCSVIIPCECQKKVQREQVAVSVLTIGRSRPMAHETSQFHEFA